MQRKALAATIEWKAEKAGAFRATFATLGVVDHDKDVTLPGAFKNGQQVVISAYMHKSWDGALPVGTGVIGSDETKAWVDGQFMDTAAGQETYKTVKALAEKGLGEWSYGYEPLKASTDQEDLNAYPGASRILKEQDVFEVSPVLKGAGIATVTESIKARKLVERIKAAATADQGALSTLAAIDLAVDQLDAMVDSLMEQFDIPDDDEGAEGDANAAANDGNMPMSFADSRLPKGLTYQQHGATALAAVQGFAARSKALAAMRAKEGRTLSAANRDRLAALQGAIASASTDLAELLSSTDLSNDGKSGEAELQKIFLGVQRLGADLSVAGISEG